MQISALHRYPVKSMLGEPVETARLVSSGLEHDRNLALIDTRTGMVATAKHPRLWRDLLRFSAALITDGVLITSPEGWTVHAADAGVDGLLSTALGRPVRMSAERPPAAEVERPDPEDVLDQGVDAEVVAPTLEIAQGTSGLNFVDYAPVHLITTATLEHIGTEQIRYRPNLVLETPPGTEAFVENDWVGRDLQVTGRDGTTTVLRVVLTTPRCSVPTLEHGELPRDPHAVRALVAENRVDVPGFGNRISFSIFQPLPNDSEGKLIAANVAAGDLVRLPEGTYHVVSTYGESNAIMRADLKVDRGRITEATLNHRAATVTLKLVTRAGGEAFAGTAFSVLTPGGDVIREAIGAFPTVTLAEGEYVLIARHNGQVYTKEFKVESGLDHDVEVPITAG